MEILERIEPRRATRTVTSLLGGPLKALVDLGVPAAFAELGELSVRALANRLEGLPAAPSLPATGIVAVVGPLHRARQLATHLGADATVASREMPRDLAAWLWIPNGAEAVNRRSRWTYRDRPMVVAVEGTPANSVKPFALDMVRSLAPAQIRVIVEAAWSVDVMAQWIKELTPLKVPVIIDVVGVDSAAQPAAVLQLGLPVATVDGMPAQPDWWASLLVERAGEER